MLHEWMVFYRVYKTWHHLPQAECRLTSDSSEVFCKVSCVCTNTCACSPWPQSRFPKWNCIAVMWGSSHTQPGFLPFALHSSEAQCTTQLWHGTPGSQHFWGKYQSKVCPAEEWQSPAAHVDTTAMCFDFVLPLVFASIWESPAGLEGKAAVVCTVHLLQLKDNNPHAGNIAWELGSFFVFFFSLFCTFCKFPLAHEVFDFWAFQSHYSEN